MHLLGGRTGLEVGRELRERHGTVRLLTTAYPPEMWPKERHGAWGLPGKPHEPDGLLAAIAYCLALTESEDASHRRPERLRAPG